MKNVLICFVVILIIAFTFVLPNILFKIEDIQMDGISVSRDKEDSNIDVEAEEIYLVKLIHDIEDGHLNLKLDKSYIVTKAKNIVNKDGNTIQDNIFARFQLELDKMQKYNVLGNAWQGNDSSDFSYSVYERNYSGTNSEYIVNNIGIETLQYGQFYAEIEKKTNKVLHYVSQKSFGLSNNLSEAEILNNYIRYLDLYIIDDWKLEENCLKSEKAKLVASIRFYENTYILSIHSSVANIMTTSPTTSNSPFIKLK